ncbi:MAG: FGGY-family carbohydrate kinase, partial [Pseudomonadota bacterium]
LGLGLDDGPLDLMQAVLEGVAFRAAEVLRAMDAAVPLQGAVSVDGGLTKNPYFVQFLADGLGRGLERQDEPEVTAFGTALLAGEPLGAPVPPASPRHETTPQPGGAERCAKFANAVSLARQWRP